MDEVDFITVDEVCELVPGMTKGRLSQMRNAGDRGLKFYKPTPRTVLYRRSEVIAWVLASVRHGTAESAV